MMIGELDYYHLFHRQHEEHTADSYHAQVWYPDVTYLLFGLFLVVMTVLVMNLLVSERWNSHCTRAGGMNLSSRH